MMMEFHERFTLTVKIHNSVPIYAYKLLRMYENDILMNCRSNVLPGELYKYTAQFGKCSYADVKNSQLQGRKFSG